MQIRESSPFQTVQCENENCVSQLREHGVVPKSVAELQRQAYGLALCTPCEDHLQREGELPENREEWEHKEREYYRKVTASGSLLT